MKVLQRLPRSTRRLAVLASLVLVPLLVALSLPGVHWRLYGWARGEAFYRNRPTTYWASEVCSYRLVWMQDIIGSLPPDWKPTVPPLSAMSVSRPDPPERLKLWPNLWPNQPTLL